VVVFPCLRAMARMKENGSAKQYSTWLDEALNRVLRRVSQSIHQLTFDFRTHYFFNLIGSLKLETFIFGAEPFSRSGRRAA
jgi:hypothetical protein